MSLPVLTTNVGLVLLLLVYPPPHPHPLKVMHFTFLCIRPCSVRDDSKSAGLRKFPG